MTQTIREYLNSYLFNKGMSESQCEEVLKLAEEHDVLKETMSDKWDNIITVYPQMMLGLLKITIDKIALEYIETNCPGAWFKPMLM